MLPSQRPPSQQQAHNPDGSQLPFSLDPFTAKQMAALQATSLAKAGNRSAPGGTSASYFGGMSMTQPNHLSRSDSVSGLEINSAPGFAPMSNFSAQGQPPNVSLHAPPAMYPSYSSAAQPQQPSHPNPALMQQQQQQQQQSHHQRKRSFLNGLANVMAMRNAPLPHSLTGVPYPPGYDPASSPWRSLEVADLGVVRLAGKDIDLYRLWAFVLQAGGGAKISQQGAWGQVLPHFDLPDQFPVPQPNGQQSVAAVLQHYYNVLIGPFEEAYRKNVHAQQRAILASRAQQQPGLGLPGTSPTRPNGLGGMPGTFPPQAATMPGAVNPAMVGMGGGQSMSGGSVPSADFALVGMGGNQFPPPTSQALPRTPQLSQQPSSGILGGTPDARSSVGPMGSVDGMLGSAGGLRPHAESNGFPSFAGHGSDVGVSGVDQEVEGRKRKLGEADDMDGKRARQKINGSEPPDARSSVPPPPGHATNAAPPARSIRQPSRRKIEYVPLAREVDTAGGRDLNLIQQELHRAAQRPLRDINEWGAVDVEALTMSIRSRISTELSYALTTFTILTLMRGQHKDSGFPISQAPDLLDEILDLLEDMAFDGPEQDVKAEDDINENHITTHRELLNLVLDDGTRPFASLKPQQGAKDPSLGPRQRPGDIVLAAMNIVRNLSVTPENQDFLAKHKRLLPVMLRLCGLRPPSEGSPPCPASPKLTLSDLISVRKDTVHTLVNIGSAVQLTSPRIARRAFELLASYVTDPGEAVPPFQCMLQSGLPSHTHTPKPPSVVDTALEAFTRLAQPDDNRRVFSSAVPHEWMWQLGEALVHRLPVTDNDFQVVMREAWMAYFERAVMALYSLAFFAPPKVKRRMKTDRQLGFTKVMLRVVRKLAVNVQADVRVHFMVAVRRAVEAMKLVDDGEDSFDTSAAAVPTLTFGMGYGEHGETRIERGMGILSGYQEDITWGLMMQRECDDLMFSELASLVRVG